jgi:hypothetical protein
MNEADSQDKPAFLMSMDSARLLQVVSLGAVIGLAVWAVTLFLKEYVFQAILCHGNQALECSSGMQYSEAVASVIGAGIGLFFLVRIQVFRPLLVVVASMVSMWGIVNLTVSLPWYGVGFACVALYAFAYAAYAWIARIRLFWLVMLLFMILIIAVRLIFSA